MQGEVFITIKIWAEVSPKHLKWGYLNNTDKDNSTTDGVLRDTDSHEILKKQESHAYDTKVHQVSNKSHKKEIRTHPFNFQKQEILYMFSMTYLWISVITFKREWTCQVQRDTCLAFSETLSVT